MQNIQNNDRQCLHASAVNDVVYLSRENGLSYAQADTIAIAIARLRVSHNCG